MSFNLYTNTSYQISRLITKSYSTSFSLATSLLEKEKRKAIYAIYGFVRLADEIVDTFHEFDKAYLLNKFEEELNYSLTNKISTNPVLHSFQAIVDKYKLKQEHINAFMKSMRADLYKKNYASKSEIDEYIYGSADVVGLMCLKVFCNGNEDMYKELEKPAQSLGSAFQKVNFLRDYKHDKQELGRVYFTELNNSELTEELKNEIIDSIERDFKEARSGIKKLPGKSRLAVMIAYKYYLALLKKVKKNPAKKVASSRVRISNTRKVFILANSYVSYRTAII